MVIIAHNGDPEKALQQQREFYELLGRAISQWSSLETEVYHTFRTVIDPGDWVASAAAYHSVLNLSTKLDMIKAAISASRKHNLRIDDWAALHRLIRKGSGRRAKLAHWTVVQDATPTNETGVSIYLEPPFYDFGAKRDENGTRDRIIAKHLADWSSGFVSLAFKTNEFWRGLEA